MSLALIIPDRDITVLIQRLQQQLPQLDIQVWPDIQRPDEVCMALVWNPPAGSLAGLPNLKTVMSYGAGVDSIMAYVDLPDVQIARIVDADLAVKMGRYLVGQVEGIRQRGQRYRDAQLARQWAPKGPIKGENIGILGAGQLGLACAKAFAALGYQVACWRRTPKQEPGMEIQVGTEGLAHLLSWADYVICLLPLTAQTKHILNASLFDKMRQSAVLINVGRGEHLNESDLIQSLATEQLSHAVLDVFQQEPLPAEHPFWTNSKITITPHVSALTSMNSIVAQVLDNYSRTCQNQPLINLVDKNAGY